MTDRTAPATASSARVSHGWRLHRRLYDWVLHWALTPHSMVALFLLAFAESSFFPVPPDVLLIALVLGSTHRWFLFALLCTAGSVLGGIAGYGVGMFLMDTIGAKVIDFYHAQAYYDKVAQWYKEYDFWIVFIAAFTPIPYKVFTIASGAFHMNLPGFTLVSIVGRGARFFLVAGLLRLVGEPMRKFIDKYFDWLALAFVALLAGGFALIRYGR
jgi:membrane protein YqaA with SNARE-associated domain